MASPVVASVKVAQPVSGPACEANNPASTAASAADVPADFATILQAQGQGSLSGALIADPKLDIAANDREPGDDTNSPAAGLASLLNAIMLPVTGQIVPPATALNVTPPTGKTPDALAGIAGTEAGSANAAATLQSAMDAACHDRLPAARDAPESVSDAVAAKFATLGTMHPAAAKETPASAGNPTPSSAVTPPHHVNSPANNSPPPTVRLDTPLGDARWAGDFGQRIVWMARQDVQAAQLTLNPPNLGPIDVSIKLGPDQATAIFSSPHAEVRDALESALPRLREMLAGAGISLGQTQVNSQSQQQTANQGHQRFGESDRSADRSVLSAASGVNLLQLARPRSGIGLVDTFA